MMTIALLTLVAVTMLAMLLCPSFVDESMELATHNHHPLNNDL